MTDVGDTMRAAILREEFIARVQRSYQEQRELNPEKTKLIDLLEEMNIGLYDLYVPWMAKVCAGVGDHDHTSAVEGACGFVSGITTAMWNTMRQHLEDPGDELQAARIAHEIIGPSVLRSLGHVTGAQELYHRAEAVLVHGAFDTIGPVAGSA